MGGMAQQDAVSTGGDADEQRSSNPSSASSREDADEAGDDAAAAEHPPTVELSLYELDVSVRGAESDSLDDVEASAENLMDYLVEQHHRLEDGPEDHQVI